MLRLEEMMAWFGKVQDSNRAIPGDEGDGSTEEDSHPEVEREKRDRERRKEELERLEEELETVEMEEIEALEKLQEVEGERRVIEERERAAKNAAEAKEGAKRRVLGKIQKMRERSV